MKKWGGKMTKFEEKFFVVNCKYLDELPPYYKGIANLLINILDRVIPKNRYYVCNQDEPYAQKVIDIILEGENEKRLKRLLELLKERDKIMIAEWNNMFKG